MAEARAWQRMLSGRRLDLLDPSPLDVEIEDIAHGLAFVARWNGQTRGEHAYSVAEHSLLVEEIFAMIVPRCETRWRLAALLHDAPEYVIGDMISPVKAAVGPGYAALDTRLARAVHIRFGLPPRFRRPSRRRSSAPTGSRPGSRRSASRASASRRRIGCSERPGLPASAHSPCASGRPSRRSGPSSTGTRTSRRE